MDLKVSIVILNWNGEDFLQACLDSVFRSTYRNIEVLVVDNGSTDRSLDIVRNDTRPRLIALEKNTGYAAANNVGFMEATGEFIVTLNNDITVDPNWLNDPVALFSSHPQVGIIAPRQMDAKKDNVIDSLFLAPSRFLIPIRAFRGQAYGSSHKHLTTGRVFGANGGSAIYRRSCIEEVGFFEESFFAFHEECDLQMRAFLKGWKCLYVPSSVVYHLGSASFNRVREDFFYYHERNRIWYIYRNFPWTAVFKYLPVILIRECRTFLNAVFRQKMFSVYIRARKDGFIGAKRFKQHRKENIKAFGCRSKEYERLLREQILPLGG